MVISFEKLRELQLAEKESNKLQHLSDNIVEEIREYLARKTAKKNKTNADIVELENIKNVIKSIFEKREHKIVELALLSSRTGMPVENLLKEEEQLFYSLISILKNSRTKFFNILKNRRKLKEQTKKEANVNPKIGEKIRITETLPPFVDKNLKVYSLKKDDIVTLPDDIKNILIKNKKAIVV
ncbi:MAG: hypothetical protein DRP08_00360 [Candidatus Aenigmatarchaeota archaeon]|nr:MAG: hypothetical protein DRP08_00360 [Candidatus Aenigmarchaeota archaeon]